MLEPLFKRQSAGKFRNIKYISLYNPSTITRLNQVNSKLTLPWLRYDLTLIVKLGEGKYLFTLTHEMRCRLSIAPRTAQPEKSSPVRRLKWNVRWVAFYFKIYLK